MTVVTAKEMYERLKSRGFKKINDNRVTGEEYENWVRERFVKFTTMNSFNIIDKNHYKIFYSDLNMNYAENIEIKTKTQPKSYINILNKYISYNQITSFNMKNNEYYLEIKSLFNSYDEKREKIEIKLNNVSDTNNELGVWNMEIGSSAIKNISYSTQIQNMKRDNRIHVEESQKWTNIQQLAC